MKFVLLLAAICYSFSFFAQDYSFNENEFLKDFEVSENQTRFYVDSTTVFSRAYLKGSAFKTGYGVFITYLDHDNGTFETFKFNDKFLEDFGIGWLRIASVNGELHHIRSELKGKKTSYFLDRIAKDHFEKANTPFFVGESSEGFNGKFLWSQRGSGFILCSFKLNTRKSTIGYISKVNLVHFNQELEELSKFEHNIDEFDVVRYEEFGLYSVGSDYFLHYPIRHPKKSKTPEDPVVVEVIRFKDNQFEVLDFKKSEIGETVSFEIMKSHDTSRIYIMAITPGENQFKLNYYQLDDNEISKLSHGVITSEQVLKDFDYKANFKEIINRSRYQRFTNFISEIDKSERYEFYYRRYESSSIGTVFRDIIIVRIKNDEIEWANFVRATNPLSIEDIQPISETTDNVIFYSTEAQGYFDENGNYIPGKIHLALTKYYTIKYTIDRRTGDFTREIVERID